jgi:hypothetical protein
MVLHGIYDKGKIRIDEKDLPDIKTPVEIKPSGKPWIRDVKPIKIKDGSIADTVCRERYEE